MKRPFEKPTLEDIVSEVGIYGTFIGNQENGGKVLWNRVEGYLVRSKVIDFEKKIFEKFQKYF